MNIAKVGGWAKDGYALQRSENKVNVQKIYCFLPTFS
jgi:hypothetical protein